MVRYQCGSGAICGWSASRWSSSRLNRAQASAPIWSGTAAIPVSSRSAGVGGGASGGNHKATPRTAPEVTSGAPQRRVKRTTARASVGPSHSRSAGSGRTKRSPGSVANEQTRTSAAASTASGISGIGSANVTILPVTTPATASGRISMTGGTATSRQSDTSRRADRSDDKRVSCQDTKTGLMLA